MKNKEEVEERQINNKKNSHRALTKVKQKVHKKAKTLNEKFNIKKVGAAGTFAEWSRNLAERHIEKNKTNFWINKQIKDETTKKMMIEWWVVCPCVRVSIEYKYFSMLIGLSYGIRKKNILEIIFFWHCDDAAPAQISNYMNSNLFISTFRGPSIWMSKLE